MQVVTAILAFLSAALTAFMTYLIARLNTKAAAAAVEVKAAAVEVKDVKTVLVATTAATAAEVKDVKTALAANTVTTEEVKDLVNGHKQSLIAEVTRLKLELAAEIARHLSTAPRRP